MNIIVTFIILEIVFTGIVISESKEKENEKYTLNDILDLEKIKEYIKNKKKDKK